MKKQATILFLICFTYRLCFGQTTFDKIYFANNGYWHGIIKTLDGNFMLSGNEGAFPNGKWCLLKIDSLGNILSKWKYDFGAGVAATCKVQQSAQDSGYYISGEGEVAGNGKGKIMKVDKNGNFLWSKYFNNMSGAPVNKGLAVSNGEFICGLGGSSAVDGYGIAKFSSSGNLMWCKTNNSNTNNVTYAIIQSSDGNYVFGGGIISGSTNYANITKMDTSGNVIWSKIISGSPASNFYVSNICQTTDGGYAVLHGGNCAQFVTKLDGSGNFLWSIFNPLYGCNSGIYELFALPLNKIGILGRDGSAYALLEEIDGTGNTYTERKITVSGSGPQYGGLVGGGCAINADGSLPGGSIMCGFTSGSTNLEVVSMKSDLTGCSVSTLTTAATSATSFSTISGGTVSTYTPPLTSVSSPTVTAPAITKTTYCNLSPLNITVLKTNPTCNGLCNGSATVTPTGGQSPFSYTWSPSGGNSSSASGLCAGTYTVSVKDAAAQTVTSIVTITQPSAITSSISSQASVTCNGGADGSASILASGGTGGYTYSWSPGGGTAATATGLTAGNYTCTIKDINLCAITQTLSITQPTLITSSVSSQTNVACNGGSDGAVTISASGGTGSYTYSWLPGGSTSATAAGLTAGNYTCTIKDANLCTKTQTISITQPAVLTATASASQYTICAGATTTLTASAGGGTSPYTYSWTPSGNGSTMAVTPAVNTTYSLSVTDSRSCAGTATIIVAVNGLPAVSISTTSNTLCVNDSPVTLTGTPAGGAYGGPGVSGNNFDPAITGVGTFTITYSYTDNNNCTNSDSTAMIVNACTATEPVFGSGQIHVYPNPFSETITVTSLPGTEHSVEVYNATGALIYTGKMQNGRLYVNLSEQPRGMYFLKMNNIIIRSIKQ